MKYKGNFTRCIVEYLEKKYVGYFCICILIRLTIMNLKEQTKHKILDLFIFFTCYLVILMIPVTHLVIKF